MVKFQDFTKTLSEFTKFHDSSWVSTTAGTLPEGQETFLKAAETCKKKKKTRKDLWSWKADSSSTLSSLLMVPSISAASES